MAVNANGEYKYFKFYEGLCSSKNFPKEIAKVLALGVKSKAQKDIDGVVISNPEVLKIKNWDIVYPAPDETIAPTEENGLDMSLNISYDDYMEYFNGTGENDIYSSLSSTQYKAKILNQIEKITDTVILRTTTTPKTLNSEDIDDLTVDPTSNDNKLTMYLEIYKPTYVANPEEYPLDCERDGITPLLVTKEMYEDSYRTSYPAEDAIYLSDICSCRNDENTIDGQAIRVTTEEYNTYCLQLQALNYTVPTLGNQGSISIVISETDIALIKQENAILYNYILNNIGTNGIEPKTYNRLNEVTMTFYRTIDSVTGEDYYSIMVSGKIPITEYSIPKGAKYKLHYKSVVDIVPEFYLDGVYIPLDSDKYYVQEDSNTITFDDNIIFDANDDGLLVVRYTYESEGNKVISERKTMLNNHYVIMRMFDNINSDGSGPAENVYNNSGEITQTNSHISPWSKLSWYRDFEEVLVDTLDEDISITSVQDGTLFVPIETAGLNADTKMRYWINTNNDRFSLIVMGNPSLDYTKDRHLISASYCGVIDSFDNSINDTAGNFALFTSSSTEPCNTVLKSVQEEAEIPNFIFTNPVNYDDLDTDDEGKNEIDYFMESCVKHLPYKSGQAEYHIQLSNKQYFNRNVTPKYMVLDSNHNAITSLKARKIVKDWDGEVPGKYDSVTFILQDEDVNLSGDYEIYFLFGYYQEINKIISGVSRDAFGNVLDVDKIKTYGNNTSDGVTSIMMFHTRSKAYYQKHHMLFATTEEYMSKVMYGKSSYTGEYYADRIKVTHGNDGPRGTLSDLLVIDSSSLYALDELVINKDFAKNPDEYEETFVYFPITAPFSPLSDSPNGRYGLAIKKLELEPTYLDEIKILKIAMSELGTIADSLWTAIDKDIVPPEVTNNGCRVFWKVVDGTAWTGNPNNPSDYVPIKLVVTNSSQYSGNLDNKMTASNEGVTLTQGTIESDGTNSYIKITGFEANEGEVLYYGISDTKITSFGGFETDAEGHNVPGSSAQLKATLFDEALDDTTEDDEGGWVYGVEGVPYTSEMQKTSSNDYMILDGTPNKYLVLYSAKSEEINGEHRCSISKFACLPLKDNVDSNHLLQYPRTFSAVRVSGNGEIATSVDGERSYSLYFTKPYSENTLTLYLFPDAEFAGTPSVHVTDEESESDINVENSGLGYFTITLDEVKNDTKIEVTFNVA